MAAVDSLPGGFGRLYRVRLTAFDPALYPKEAGLSLEDVLSVAQGAFRAKLLAAMEKESKRRGGAAISSVDLGSLAGGRGGGDDEAAATGAGRGGDDEGAGTSGRGARRAGGDDDDDDDADGEEADGKLRFRARGEKATTYDAPDEEERALMAAAAETARAARRSDSSDGSSDSGAAGAGGADADGDEIMGAASKSGIAISGGRVEGLTVSITLSLPLTAPKLLMLELVERVAAETLVRATPGITKCYVVDGTRGECVRVQTDGINFVGAWGHSDLVDVNRVTTNHVAAMLATYGVEAARATILQEASAVFGAYGIGVDSRHLSLIADFMTHAGGYRACNRLGMESSTSPLLKMSFETAAHFLTDASLKHSADDLRSPASRICVGRVVELGTGVMGILQQIPAA